MDEKVPRTKFYIKKGEQALSCHLGRKSMKIFRTQGAILCVAGVRKFTFSTPIVTTTENVTKIMVKSRYWLVTVIKAR